LEKAEQEEAQVAKSIKRVEQDQQELCALMEDVRRQIAEISATWTAVEEDVREDYTVRGRELGLQGKIVLRRELQADLQRLEQSELALVDKEKALRAEKCKRITASMNAQQEFSTLKNKLLEAREKNQAKKRLSIHDISEIPEDFTTQRTKSLTKQFAFIPNYVDRPERKLVSDLMQDVVDS